MQPLLSRNDFERLAFDARGLLPVVVQDVGSGVVLMVAYTNAEALERTLETSIAHFYSRSRQQLWRKGETSGNELEVQSIHVDCDVDTLLFRVRPKGPTCHLGRRSCFDPVPPQLELGWLAEVVASRARGGDDESSYTARLLRDGRSRVAQKVGEEAVELALAAVDAGDEATAKSEVAEEAADLLFHVLVLLESAQVPLSDVSEVLRARHRSMAPPAREETQ